MFGMSPFRICWAAAGQEIIQAEQRASDISFCSTGEHVEPCCLVLCRTKQGRKTCARRQEKHAPDRARWVGGGGEGGRGVYLGSKYPKDGHLPPLFFSFFLLCSQYRFFFCVDNFSKIMNIKFKAEQVSICKYLTHYSFSTLTNSYEGQLEKRNNKTINNCQNFRKSKPVQNPR
jgi:hypothetical protein